MSLVMAADHLIGGGPSNYNNYCQAPVFFQQPVVLITAAPKQKTGVTNHIIRGDNHIIMSDEWLELIDCKSSSSH